MIQTHFCVISNEILHHELNYFLKNNFRKNLAFSKFYNVYRTTETKHKDPKWHLMVLETVMFILKGAVSFDNQDRTYFPKILFIYQYMGCSVSLLTYYSSKDIERIFLKIY